MPKRFAWLALLLAWPLSGADLQGVIVDWNCAQPMVEKGRRQTFKDNRSGSMMKDYNRSAYGLITADKKYYRLDDNGNRLARQLLANTPDKDDLKVIVTGDVDGGSIKVANMSEL
jgi:hypothetical protein